MPEDFACHHGACDIMRSISRAERTSAQPNNKPNQAKPDQAKPDQTKPDQIKLTQQNQARY